MKLEKREEYKFKEYRSEVLEHKEVKLKTGKHYRESQWHQNVIIWKDNRNDNPLARLNKKKMKIKLLISEMKLGPSLMILQALKG